MSSTKAFERDDVEEPRSIVSNTLVVSNGSVTTSNQPDSDWLCVVSRPCVPVSDQYPEGDHREGTVGPLKPHDWFLKYSIVREIGAGGYARVYQAYDAFLKREVALKIIHRPTANREELLRRTSAEARFLVAVKHPYLVDVYDAGYDDRRVLYIAMELLRGKPLRSLVRSMGKLPWDQFIPMGIKLADALQIVHERRVIHRDIKPENIFIMKDGSPKLLDFGIAKFIDAPAMITRKNVFHGTPTYMAPEQLGGRPASVQSDMYSLGMVFWEVLAGEHPLQLSRAKSTDELLWRHLHFHPPMLDEVHPEIPRRLARVIHRMIAKTPGQRQGSMQELALELEHCFETSMTTGPRDSRSTARGPASSPLPERLAVVPRSTLAARVVESCRPKTWTGTISLALAVGVISFSVILGSAKAIRATGSAGPARATATSIPATATSSPATATSNPATATSGKVESGNGAHTGSPFAEGPPLVLETALPGLARQRPATTPRTVTPMATATATTMPQETATTTDLEASPYIPPLASNRHRMVLPNLDMDIPSLPNE